MESLSEETWDLVIAGTGLVQALLALSLSRSDLKILHVDQNSYYGGVDAGLSLDEARLWSEKYRDTSNIFSSAQIHHDTSTHTTLAASRAYTLSLNPQIIYAQSSLLPSLVSSNINTQLEFLAVGSWWICKDGKLQKVPSSREDVFADDNLSRRDKIGLMKFLRYVLKEDSEAEESEGDTLQGELLRSALTSKFKISPHLQLPISALALTQQSVQETAAETAVLRVRRHMRSMGYFGPGFGAVLAKYAGNAEIAQVCCRACAVGGGTYLLGQGVSKVDSSDTKEAVEVTLVNGITVKAKRFAGSIENIPPRLVKKLGIELSQHSLNGHLISIISSPLRHLFPATSDSGPVPAAAIVMVTDTDDAEEALVRAPIYFQIHSEDTGECPSGQCIIYASTLHSKSANPEDTFQRLTVALQRFLKTSISHTANSEAESANPAPEVLWSMSYISSNVPVSTKSADRVIGDESGQVLVFSPLSQDIAFDDHVLSDVKDAWKTVLGNEADETEFLRFSDRTEAVGLDEE